MRIYEFEYKSGETDWVFAPTMEEAKEFYLSFTGCGDLDGCEVNIVLKKEWKNNVIIDTKETFEEYAARNTQTDMIATTEF